MVPKVANSVDQEQMFYQYNYALQQQNLQSCLAQQLYQQQLSQLQLLQADQLVEVHMQNKSSGKSK